MRKPVAILSVFLLLVQSGGYLLFFKAEQVRIRHEVKEKIIESLPDDQLVVLVFSKSSQTFLTAEGRFINDHEIRSDEIMYDVVRTEIEGDHILYYCFADHQESTLVKNLDLLIDRTTQQHPTTLQHLQLLQHVIQPYFPSIAANCQLFPKTISNSLPPYLFPLKTWCKLRETPPPQDY